MAAPNETIIRARQLRRSMTLPEGKLWQILRARPSGFKFRRQHPVGPYVLDFYCPAAKLAIEVDGIAHDMGDRPAHDQRRDNELRTHGIETMRIDAVLVLRDANLAVEQIVATCRAYPSTTLRVVPLPAASPQGGS